MKFYKNFRKIFFLKNNYFIFFFFALSIKLYSDNFNSNFYNNHGVVGLINTPTARFYDESVFGLTLYDGTPPQKITLTSNPFDWLVFSQVLFPIISNFATSAAAIAALGNNN